MPCSPGGSQFHSRQPASVPCRSRALLTEWDFSGCALVALVAAVAGSASRFGVVDVSVGCPLIERPRECWLVMPAATGRRAVVAGHGGHPDIVVADCIGSGVTRLRGLAFWQQAISRHACRMLFSEQLTQGVVPVSGLFVGFIAIIRRAGHCAMIGR